MRVSIETRPDGKCIVTLEEIWFSFGGRTYCVPAGYASDGASVPRFLWRLLSPCIDPQTMVPSIVHDFLYDWHLGSRQEADWWYADALDGAGYPLWKTMLTLFGLRLFGGRRWRGK